jgi:hypothetical protein
MSTPRTAVLAGLLLGIALPAGAQERMARCGNDYLYRPVPWSKTISDSPVILHGFAANPRHRADGTPVTDLVILDVLKGADLAAGTKTVELEGHVPIKDANHPPRLVIFAEVQKRKLEVSRVVEVSPAATNYLKNLTKFVGQDRQALLRYCFDFLEHPARDLATDAYLEIEGSQDSELRRFAVQLPPDRLRSWLRDKSLPLPRVGLYALLLGHCGTARDADLLRQLIQDHGGKGSSYHIERLWCGHTLLQPREGWAHVHGALQDPNRDFTVRYAALRSVRFFHESRPDVIGRTEVLQTVAAVLNDPEMADFAVEDLRRWREWQLTDHVLSLAARKSHDVPVVRRAVLRYALQCPDPHAARFVAAWRRDDPKGLADTEEHLRLEQEMR